MTDISTDTATDIPEFPMTRAPGCPFAPPPKALELNTDKQLSRVRIWDDSTPWLIHGYDAIRALFTDSRTSVDDRLPGIRTGTKECWRRCIHGRVRSSPPTPKSTPASAGCCQNRSPSSASKRYVQRCRRSPTITSTPCWPDLKPGDIISTLALPVPSLVISQLLGVPYEDADFFQEQAQRGTGRYATAEDTAQGAASLAKYLANLVRVRCAVPQRIWCPTSLNGSTLKRSACARPHNWPPGC